jgi:hypothetical protein
MTTTTLENAKTTQNRIQRCDICIEEECKGAHNCYCDTCKNIAKCYKFLHPTIRITTKCTQSCIHCCWSCSPKHTDMMSIETAKQIRDFILSNNIQVISLMGGEFFCNPDWKNIFSTLISDAIISVRLVTNGDWAHNPKDHSTIEFLSGFSNLRISISKDSWHNNINVEKAVKQCKSHKIQYNVATDKETTQESIVPVGKGSLHFSTVYSMFGCYCHNPEHSYSFLIDETGKVFKCGFGLWNYTHVSKHLTGGFNVRFKEFNQVFNSVFISNCASCARQYAVSKDVDLS